MIARRLVGWLQRQPKPGWRVLLLDECHATFFPTRAPQWAKRGQNPEFPLLHLQGRWVVFGAADLSMERLFHHLAHSLSGAEQLHLLAQITATYPEERVLLVGDNGPTHRNRQVASWLARHRRIVCFWAPFCSGVDANLLQHCWRWFREHVTHTHLFQTLEELNDAARQCFRDVANSRPAVLNRLGLM